MIPDELLVTQVTLEPYAGTGAYGDIFGAPVPVPAYVEDVRKVVLSSTGDEVVSESTVHCNLGVDFPAGSRVTVNGRVATVIKVSLFDDGGLTGLDHQEVATT